MNRWKVALASGLLYAASTGAAVLPPHEGLRILVVSDEVNPHGLPPSELTQPGEISAALLAPGSGLTLDDVVEIHTDDLEQATALLPDYDVLIYFSHRIPTGADGPLRQANFTAAVEQFLIDGGGVVAFHHGAYVTAGKEAIQELLGGTASRNVPWNTVDGQDVINVAPPHFITCNEVAYTGSVAYADPGRGVAAGNYDLFNNTPDERYINYELNPTAEQIEVLFGSDYVENGSTHLLGFTHRRAGWEGVVVAYQPGEHQPTALDLAGPNFQILANAIVWAARRVPEDGVSLAVSRGPGVDEVTLDWSGCSFTHAVYAGGQASDVVDPPNQLGSTAAGTWTHTGATADLIYYQVVPTP